MTSRLLAIALPDWSPFPSETHLLLCQKLVLEAVIETRSTDISFIGCPSLAKSFSVEATNPIPDMTSHLALTILGSPDWLPVQASHWTEILTPNESLTSYTKGRIKTPMSPEHGALMAAGISRVSAAKLLHTYSLGELKAEASTVMEGVAKKLKISDLTDVFRQKKVVEAVLKAQVQATVPIKTYKLSWLLENFDS